MRWSQASLVFRRELSDQLRDRRTLFMIAILPVLLYPLLGMTMMQITQFLREHPTNIWVIGAEELPADPPLLANDHFSLDLFPGDATAQQMAADLLPLDIHWKEGDEEILQQAREKIASGEYDAVVIFPPGFRNQLSQITTPTPATPSEATPEQGNELTPALGEADVPRPTILYNATKDRSRIAHDRLANLLGTWHDTIVANNLEFSEIPPTVVAPFHLEGSNLAVSENQRSAIWSKLLPFVLLIWALTGAFYPAIDLCAGEKERGTLETLLCSPAQRTEIVIGKLLTVMVFSMATAALNVLSLMFTASIALNQLHGLSPQIDQIGAPSPSVIGWLLVALVPLAALFSALSLALAAMARSTKEGQYYLMPLLLITLPLMLLPMLPAVELDLGMSVIPVTGVLLLLRTLLEGEMLVALRYALPVIGVTFLGCWLAVRWAVDQFNNESVLFREGERLDLGAWFMHVLRDRGDSPSVTAAVLCGILLLMARFFASLQAPTGVMTWKSFAMTQSIVQIGLIALPAVLMALIFTRRPGKSLLLTAPRPLPLLAALALAICVHPLAYSLGALVQKLYPINQATAEAMNSMLQLPPSLGQALLMFAVMPAICEELAFRGFILSGLRRMGHKWRAILISSVFFGVAHGILQQSIMATAVGIILGFVAIQTGSLLPCVIFHLTYNGLSVIRGTAIPWLVEHFPLVNWLVLKSEEEYYYRSPLVAACGVATIALLFWFRKLPYQISPEEELRYALDHQHAPKGDMAVS